MGHYSVDQNKKINKKVLVVFSTLIKYSYIIKVNSIPYKHDKLLRDKYNAELMVHVTITMSQILNFKKSLHLTLTLMENR